MAVRLSIVIVALAAVAALVLLTTEKPARVKAPDCPPAAIVIDRSNSVHGLKNDRLFAYVDLAEMAPALACHSDAEIEAALLPAVTESVKEWWQEERLRNTPQAEVHIISILDKDEYARANFNAALVHGKLEFTRDGTKVQALPASLSFDNMRNALARK